MGFRSSITYEEGKKMLENEYGEDAQTVSDFETEYEYLKGEGEVLSRWKTEEKIRIGESLTPREELYEINLTDDEVLEE